MKSKYNYYLILISLIFGFFLTSLTLGLSNLSPTNIDWISSHDTKSDFLALKFFINDEWHFPVGLNPNYGDITNSIVFSGAVPFLAFLSKIFKNFLPTNFHFFSLWIIICLSLQFLYSFKIVYFFTKKKSFSFLCAIFFLFLPTLYYRLNIHLSLSAHWIIFSYFYYELKNYEKAKIFIILLSCLVHFYLTIMLLLVRLIFIIDFLFKKKKIQDLLIKNFWLIFLLTFTMYVSGYFILPSTDTLGYGFGIYKANLLTFFDPVPSGSNFNWSLFLPDIKNNFGEHEGFAYLGIGGILLLFISLILYINKKNLIKIHYKYLTIVIIFLLISLSNNVGFAHTQIVNIPISNYLYAPLSIIRASGRFIWIVYYALILFALMIFYKSKIRKEYLIFVLVLQIIDTSVFFKNKTINDIDLKNENNLFNFEKNLINNYSKIYSTYSSDNSNIFYQVSDILMKNSFEKTNIFRLGRYDRVEQSVNKSYLYSKMLDLNFDTDTIYVIENFDHLRHVKHLIKDLNHGLFNKQNIWYLIPEGKNLMSPIDFKKKKEIDFYEIILNSKENIYFKDKKGILGFGWSHGSYGKVYNNSGAWTEGNKSFLIFNNNEISDLKVESVSFEILQVMNVNNSPLNINVYLNNKFLTKIKLDKYDKKIQLNLQKKLKKGVNEILFEILNPITPVSKLDSVDGRLLGFKINSFIFN